LVAAVFVNYFKAERLVLAIESLRRQETSDRVHVVVVDNSCADDEYERLRSRYEDLEFVLIRAEQNLGYTRACNLIEQYAGAAEYILLQNPDVLWQEVDGLSRLVARMQQDPKIGVLAPLQFNDDGSVAEIARRFPSIISLVRRRLPVFKAAPETSMLEPILTGMNEADIVPVDWLQSSCVLIRCDLWARAGGLNERYFLFMADIEICQAAHEAGLSVAVFPETRVKGDGKRASAGGVSSLLSNKVVRIHVRDACRYFLSNGPLPASRHSQAKGADA
jgi:GT2 family glycosyltransferase